LTDFWEIKRQQLQKQGKLPQARPEPVNYNGAWWADEDTRLNRNPAADMTRDNSDEHDFSKAQHLKDRAGSCPNCNSPDFMSVAASAPRCFACGYIQGRQVNDLDTFAVAVDANTLKVRQTQSSQGIRIGKSVAEINAANRALQLSEHGKAKIDS
jgi:hypothetical protein